MNNNTTRTTGGQSYGKPTSGTVSAAPASSQPARQLYSLKIKEGEKFNTLCNMVQFVNDDGSTVYKVSRDESPAVQYAIYQNLEKASETAPDYTLKAKDAETGKFSVRVTGLWTRQTKSGQDYLQGLQKDGEMAGAYYLFTQDSETNKKRA